MDSTGAMHHCCLDNFLQLGICQSSYSEFLLSGMVHRGGPHSGTSLYEYTGIPRVSIHVVCTYWHIEFRKDPSRISSNEGSVAEGRIVEVLRKYDHEKRFGGWPLRSRQPTLSTSFSYNISSPNWSIAH